MLVPQTETIQEHPDGEQPVVRSPPVKEAKEKLSWTQKLSSLFRRNKRQKPESDTQTPIKPYNTGLLPIPLQPTNNRQTNMRSSLDTPRTSARLPMAPRQSLDISRMTSLNPPSRNSLENSRSPRRSFDKFRARIGRSTPRGSIDVVREVEEEGQAAAGEVEANNAPFSAFRHISRDAAPIMGSQMPLTPFTTSSPGSITVSTPAPFATPETPSAPTPTPIRRWASRLKPFSRDHTTTPPSAQKRRSMLAALSSHAEEPTFIPVSMPAAPPSTSFVEQESNAVPTIQADNAPSIDHAGPGTRDSSHSHDTNDSSNSDRLTGNEADADNGSCIEEDGEAEAEAEAEAERELREEVERKVRAGLTMQHVVPPLGARGMGVEGREVGMGVRMIY